MAASIRQATGLDAELIVGGRGEFTVWVDDRKVGQKEDPDQEIVDAVRQTLTGFKEAR